MKEDGERGAPCGQRDTAVLSPSREIFTSEFPGPERRNKPVAGRGFPWRGRWDGSAPTATRGWGAPRDTRAGEAPTALRGHAGVAARERARFPHHPAGKKPMPFPPPGYEGPGSDPCGDPQKYHSGSSPTPTGPRRPRGVVTKFVEMNLERARGSAAAARGRRDEWPEGMGWAPPAAAQMFLRGTPPLLWSPLGRAGPEGARGGGSCSPLVSQLNN